MSDRNRIYATAGVFAVSILLVSIILGVLSLAFAEYDFVSRLLGQFASMGVAAFVATVFFSFKDVRDVISASITNLVVDGTFLRLLSRGSRRRLGRQIVHEDLRSKLGAVPESLMDLLEEVRDDVLGQVHIHNFSPTWSFADDTETPGVIRRHYRCTYTVSAQHLAGQRGTYRLRLRQELSDPDGILADANPLKEFSIRLGDQEYGMGDVEVNQRKSGGTTVTLISLDRDIEVNGELSVTISEETVASPSDPTEIMYVWYPTRGVRATLLYSPEMAYDVAWFKPWTGLLGDFPGREQVIEMPTGIVAYTDEWLLPGHGVILYWFSPETSHQSGEGNALKS